MKEFFIKRKARNRDLSAIHSLIHSYNYSFLKLINTLMPRLDEDVSEQVNLLISYLDNCSPEDRRFLAKKSFKPEKDLYRRGIFYKDVIALAPFYRKILDYFMNGENVVVDLGYFPSDYLIHVGFWAYFNELSYSRQKFILQDYGHLDDDIYKQDDLYKTVIEEAEGDLPDDDIQNLSLEEINSLAEDQFVRIVKKAANDLMIRKGEMETLDGESVIVLAETNLDGGAGFPVIVTVYNLKLVKNIGCGAGGYSVSVYRKINKDKKAFAYYEPCAWASNSGYELLEIN